MRVTWLWIAGCCAWWASSCVLDRGGGFESASVGAGGAGSACRDDSECAGTTCRPGVCRNRVCADDVAPAETACTEDGGELCDGAGRCVRTDGTPCGSGVECQNGQCVDGICCNIACTADCQSCALRGSVGTCTPHPAATDPELDCIEGTCDGSSKCAHGQPLGTSLKFGGTGDQAGVKIAIDGVEHRVITTTFGSSITFDVTHTSVPGGIDIALAKLSAEGGVVWSRHFGGTGNEFPNAVKTDAANQIFFGGYFTLELIIDDTVLNSAAQEDIFVAKLDVSGNRIWARRFGTIGTDVLVDLAVRESGNVVLTGFAGGAMGFDGTNTAPYGGARDIVVAELAGSDGAVVWSTSFGGSGDDEGLALAVDEDDNVLVTGWYAGPVTFGSTVLDSTNRDAFLLELGDAGEVEWAQRLGGSGDELGRALAVVGDEVLVAGDFNGSMTLGSEQFTSADGQSDVFVARIEQAGAVVWAQALAGAGPQHLHHIAVDKSSNVVLSGALTGTPSIGVFSLPSAGAFDAYLIKLAADGAPLWGRRFGDGADQVSNGVAIDEAGDTIATGWFQSSIDFGDGNPHTSAGAADAYLMALTP